MEEIYFLPRSSINFEMFIFPPRLRDEREREREGMKSQSSKGNQLVVAVNFFLPFEELLIEL
jgi:hypothetical protein